MAAARTAKWMENEALERQRQGRRDLGANLHQGQAGRSGEKTGGLLNVSRRSVVHAAKVLRNGCAKAHRARRCRGTGGLGGSPAGLARPRKPGKGPGGAGPAACRPAIATGPSSRGFRSGAPGWPRRLRRPGERRRQGPHAALGGDARAQLHHQDPEEAGIALRPAAPCREPDLLI